MLDRRGEIFRAGIQNPEKIKCLCQNLRVLFGLGHHLLLIADGLGIILKVVGRLRQGLVNLSGHFFVGKEWLQYQRFFQMVDDSQPVLLPERPRTLLQIGLKMFLGKRFFFFIAHAGKTVIAILCPLKIFGVFFRKLPLRIA